MLLGTQDAFLSDDEIRELLRYSSEVAEKYAKRPTHPLFPLARKRLTEEQHSALIPRCVALTGFPAEDLDDEHRSHVLVIQPREDWDACHTAYDLSTRYGVGSLHARKLGNGKQRYAEILVFLTSPASGGEFSIGRQTIAPVPGLAVYWRAANPAGQQLPTGEWSISPVSEPMHVLSIRFRRAFAGRPARPTDEELKLTMRAVGRGDRELPLRRAIGAP